MHARKASDRSNTRPVPLGHLPSQARIWGSARTCIELVLLLRPQLILGTSAPACAGGVEHGHRRGLPDRCDVRRSLREGGFLLDMFLRYLDGTILPAGAEMEAIEEGQEASPDQEEDRPRPTSRTIPFGLSPGARPIGVKRVLALKIVASGESRIFSTTESTERTEPERQGGGFWIRSPSASVPVCALCALCGETS